MGEKKANTGKNKRGNEKEWGKRQMLWIKKPERIEKMAKKKRKRGKKKEYRKGEKKKGREKR